MRITTTTTAAVACLVFGLSGCSNNSDIGTGALAGGQFAGYNIEDIVAAYKDDIEAYRQSVSSDAAQRILEDGWVADEELAEVQSRFKTCLADAGIEGVTFYSNGSYNLGSEGVREDFFAEHDLETMTKQEMLANPEYRCLSETDETVIEAVYQMMRTNPENIDSDTLMLECLKDKGAVAQGFTMQDLYKAYENADVESTLMQSDEYLECLIDPLGLLPEVREVEVP